MPRISNNTSTGFYHVIYRESKNEGERTGKSKVGSFYFRKVIKGRVYEKCGFKTAAEAAKYLDKCLIKDNQPQVNNTFKRL